MYNEAVPEYGDRLTIKEYLGMVYNNSLLDYDGYGHPARDGVMDNKEYILPSDGNKHIPHDATHIIWFNK